MRRTATGPARRRARGEWAGWVDAAERLLSAGQCEQAIAPLLVAARLDPHDPGVLNALGVAHMAGGRISEAIAWLRRSIAADPDVAESHYNLGLALQHLGADDAAIGAYGRAVLLSPDLTAAHAQLAELLGGKGLQAEAVAAYEKAHASGPSTLLGRLCGIQALLAESRDADAEQALRRLVADEPSSSLALVLLGRLMQETGRFDEASTTFERAIAVDPSQTNAYHGLVASRQLRETDRPWLSQILARLQALDGADAQSPVLADRHRMLLHFAAGKACDDLGDLAMAMEHFDAGNLIRRQACPFDRQDAERRVAEIIARFPSERLASGAGDGDPDETPVLIVGLPRSGTTLLERMIASHPRVLGRGELAFWNDRGPAWLEAEPDALAQAGGSLCRHYLRLLRRGASADIQRATDKMPFNFQWLGLVHLLLPNARIVHIRRDPIETLLSIYATPFPARWGFAGALPDLAHYHRLYVRVMEHWSAVIPADRLMHVDYETLVAEPEATLRAVARFLGLQWDAACLRPEDNPGAVRTASSWQARQPLYRSSVARWHRYDPWVRELRRWL